MGALDPRASSLEQGMMQRTSSAVTSSTRSVLYQSPGIQSEVLTRVCLTAAAYGFEQCLQSRERETATLCFTVQLLSVTVARVQIVLTRAAAQGSSYQQGVYAVAHNYGSLGACSSLSHFV